MAIRTDTFTKECSVLISSMEWDEDACEAVEEKIAFEGRAEFSATETAEGSNTFEASVVWPEVLKNSLIAQERREWSREYESRLAEKFPDCKVIWF